MMYFSTLASAALFAAPTLAGYTLVDDYMSDFYGSFNFFTGSDPTHGFVKYVDDSTARSMGLIDASGPPVPVKWGVDTVNKDPEGRASIRLESKKAYNKGLFVIDIEHMPFGCGTWPAFWMFGPNWPYQGEIDILEGVHEQEFNGMTLHTGPGCSINDDTSLFTGNAETLNCDVKAEGQAENAGCAIKSKDNRSYGAGLNDNGGGVYATQWTGEQISVWFFPRDSVPEGVTGDNPDPSTWGTPSAKWVKESCDVDTMFKDLNIIFDTTFCGDWAGNTWSTSSCASKASTCIDFVRDNPDAFNNAFWTVNALKVYTDDPNVQPPAVEEKPVEEQPVGEQPPVEETPVEETPVEETPVEETPVEELPPVESAPITEPVPTIEPFPSNTTFESPPIIDPSDVANLPIPTGVPIEQTPDGTPFVPGDADEDLPAEEVEQPSAQMSILPVADPTGGFNWPGRPSGVPPRPSLNDTGYPTPTGGLTSIDWATVPSFPTSIPTELASAPVDEMPVATVQQTIYHTVVVTVNGGGQAEPTPVPAPEPIEPIQRRARREREMRRRRVLDDRRA